MKAINYIKVKGARVNNLKNIDIDIPRNKLVIITGVSGSGKSSLAFDVLYSEGQRRYIESLSSYAKQFLGVRDMPNIEKIEGISPAIAISPKKAIRNPRSTVGTTTEIYDYLRLLYSKIGIPHCPNCGKLLVRQNISQITKRILDIGKGSEVMIMGPVIRQKKGEHGGVLEDIRRKGFLRVRVDGAVYKTDEIGGLSLDIHKKHNIEAVIDSFLLNEELNRERLRDSLGIGLRVGKGTVIAAYGKGEVFFNENYLCEDCGISLPELEPRLFSFNNPIGACPECTGLGEKLEIDPNLLVPNKNLTLEEGAILPLVRSFKRDKSHDSYWRDLLDVSQKYKIPINVPVKDIPDEKMDIVLHGRDNFEGAISYLEKKYHESHSDWIHQEIEQYMVIKRCPKCLGKRLKPEVLAVKVFDKSIDDIAKMSIGGIKAFFEKDSAILQKKISKSDGEIAMPIIREIIGRCKVIINVGIGYLTLFRKTASLSGGEEQRIRLAIQISAKLNGVLYVLDEPSIGLHARDQKNLIKILKELRDLGNTVVVVEHDAQTIEAGDWIIDIGPGAGNFGGKIIFEGKPEKILGSKTLTGEYLSGRKRIEFENNACVAPAGKIIIRKAEENNLKSIDVEIPLEKFVCVSGVSGSGKSSLVEDILAKFLLKKIYRAKDEPGKFKEIIGAENFNKVVVVDQSPIGRTPRSNPVTYCGAFFYIRDLFARTREARARGYTSGRFSFNAKGGRCEACEGQGQIKVEMYFLPDIYVECKECKGKRYNKEALEIDYKGKNIAEVLDMTVGDAASFFQDIPGLSLKLKTLEQVGLSYMKLGQSAPSLSGGEAQRVKLATELSRKDTGKTLYILDEPTTGLHFDDIKKLISILLGLVKKGNTVLCVEHNLDFIRCADWVIDLGPEGGEGGGYLVAAGTPDDIEKNKKSWTGKYLKLASIKAKRRKS